VFPLEPDALIKSRIGASKVGALFNRYDSVKAGKQASWSRTKQENNHFHGKIKEKPVFFRESR